MPSPRNPLEYAEEEDIQSDDGLFTDEEELSQAIADSVSSAVAEQEQRRNAEAGPSVNIQQVNPSAQPPSATSKSRPKVHLAKMEKVGLGAKPLRDYCAKIIMRYRTSILDVGEEMMYEQIQFMLDVCDRPQLAEIEANSPQLKPDTDHLWQAFMSKEYGKRYQEILNTRQGKPVKSWRKLFRLEKERQEERASKASDRLKENYARLQEEKLAKKMVVITEPKAKKRKVASGGGRGAGLGGGLGGGSWGSSAPMNKLDKIRRDTSAARRSLTHASGLARPMPPSGFRAGAVPTNPFVARQTQSLNHFQSATCVPPPRPSLAPSSASLYKYSTPGMSVTPAQQFDPSLGTGPRMVPSIKTPPPPTTLRPIVKPAVKNFQPPKPGAHTEFFNVGPRPPPKMLKRKPPSTG